MEQQLREAVMRVVCVVFGGATGAYVCYNQTKPRLLHGGGGKDVTLTDAKRNGGMLVSFTHAHLGHDVSGAVPASTGVIGKCALCT